MKLNHVSLLAILLILAAIFLSGCMQQQATNLSSGADKNKTTSQTETGMSPLTILYHPTNIKIFAAAAEGEIIRFYFSLEDADGYNVPDDGQANLQIKDSVGKTVLTKSFNFKASEFVDYQFALTGQGIGKAYEWRINKADIQKGIGTGTAELMLTTGEGKVIKSADTYVQIPTYTEEEIKQIYDDNYSKTAKSSGETIKKGNFEITLARYGFYTHLKYDTLGDEVTDFRVDLIVKNVGLEKDSFSTYDGVIISGLNQYERSFNSKLDSSGVYPGIIKEGYLIFEDIPKTLTYPIKVIAGTSYDASYNKLTYEFNVKT